MLPVVMTTVGLKQSHQDASELVWRVEAGEQIEITVAGRPAARLVPTSPRQWLSWDEIDTVFAGPGDDHWETDRDLVDGSVCDPWEPRG